MAIFSLIAGAPACVSFLFGFARDTWNPFGMRDRGFMVLFGGLCAAIYVLFALAPVTYQSLLVANLLLGTAFLFVASAQNGLTSALGQQHVMSGQVSTAWNIFGSLPGIAALIFGGSLSDLMEGHDAGRKLPLKTLLFWGTVVAIPQFVPLLFIQSVTGALIAAAPIGLMGGVATAAYLDLMIRSCPRGLQGTLLMLSAALYAIVAGLGNLLGTSLYDHFGGFTVCVIAITVVYALILPVLLLVPKRLIDTADGQTPAVAFTVD